MVKGAPVVKRAAVVSDDRGRLIAEGGASFGAWIHREFAMSRSMATKFMHVAETCGNQLVDVNQLARLSNETIYPDTPEEVRTEVIQRAEAGERVAARCHRVATCATVWHSDRGSAHHGLFRHWPVRFD